ncbi:nuclear matrix protein [Colletotrichum truncatum]|uniref:Nuclear matrix protein n=1 Tax=Colletotrichum truncatum TaxID=5467 RepID=A0ACC3YFX6_COLTU|nr:nuclear matrix protein [Colletotrichum truncatum]KAF6784527.1 nuclear matrix protein [Colletotrichum truncatum]
MPATIAPERHEVPGVVSFARLLDDLLARSTEVKSTPTIEPALQKADFGDLDNQLAHVFAAPDASEQENGASSATQRKAQQFAIIETAVRDMFSNLIATTTIESPDFVKVWNLFDLLAVLSDDEKCDPALLFWLVEELLDSQTIAGCRKIFDFLESRRERITVKHFKQKQLVILRSCNELLRRLSRAEDTAFCGRVFIFMFQSFPLGDKSSVNLRGEYHVENVTVYDDLTTKNEDIPDQMDVDKPAEAKDAESKSQAKAVSFDPKKPIQADQPLEPDVLYPLFWSLQETFSQPKKLFEPENLASFKRGLEATMTSFRAIQNEQGQRPPKAIDEAQRSLKRKREDAEEGDLANSYNPKYLTSRDLFELEMSDISFRRHILVQALIIMDFLLSLSSKVKEKLAGNAQNKSVIYMGQVLSDEDTKWATEMKKTIVEKYLKHGVDGPYFCRVVETVLARDKNWVRWKSENCPSIELPPVPPETFLEAKKTVQRTATKKRLRATPMGSLSLNFLEDGNEKTAMQKLKAEERYSLPELESFKRKIADDDFEIEMPTNNQTKAAAVESKASKSWRALRIASKTRLALFDKIDDPDKIDAVFEEPVDADEAEAAAEEAVNITNVPEDKRPIVISGPPGVGKATIFGLLAARHPGAFTRVPRHTTRKPQEGEVDGQHFHFVEAQAFNMLRDGDALLEFTMVDDVDYGTSRKAVDAVAEGGKVPVMYMDSEAVQQVRDLGFSARFVLLLPPSKELLAERLKKAGKSDSVVQEMLSKAVSYLETSTANEGFDLVLTNEDLGTTVKDLEGHIYGTGGGEKLSDEKPAEIEVTGEDAAMVDAPAEEPPVEEETQNEGVEVAETIEVKGTMS